MRQFDYASECRGRSTYKVGPNVRRPKPKEDLATGRYNHGRDLQCQRARANDRDDCVGYSVCLANACRRDFTRDNMGTSIVGVCEPECPCYKPRDRSVEMADCLQVDHAVLWETFD